MMDDLAILIWGFCIGAWATIWVAERRLKQLQASPETVIGGVIIHWAKDIASTERFTGDGITVRQTATLRTTDGKFDLSMERQK